MAAGLRDKAAAVKQPRDRTEKAILDGHRQANVSSAYVAQRGEAAIEARRHKPCRKMRQVRSGRLHHPDDIQPGRIHMNVGIDQSRHQHAVGTIDDLFVARGRAIGNLA